MTFMNGMQLDLDCNAKKCAMHVVVLTCNASCPLTISSRIGHCKRYYFGYEVTLSPPLLRLMQIEKCPLQNEMDHESYALDFADFTRYQTTKKVRFLGQMLRCQ